MSVLHTEYCDGEKLQDGVCIVLLHHQVHHYLDICIHKFTHSQESWTFFQEFEVGLEIWKLTGKIGTYLGSIYTEMTITSHSRFVL